MSLLFQDISKSVRICTHVSTCSTGPPPSSVGCSSEELSKAFQQVQRASQSTTGSKRYADEALDRIQTLHASHLSTFFLAYMYPNGEIPEKVLDEVMTLCAHSDPDWAYRCQLAALEILYKEVCSRSQSGAAKMKPDDPPALASLRGVLPAMDPVPKSKIKMCHVVAVGCPREGHSLPHFSPEKVIVKNKGWKPFSVSISQTLTVVDGKKKKWPSLLSSEGMPEVKPGDRVEFCFQKNDKALPNAFSHFQQLIVLSIGGVIRMFVTVIVLSLEGRKFGVRPPQCLPLLVKESPLGDYNAPLVLQLLKHLFVAQHGYSSPAVSHLLLGKSVNFQVHNETVMKEVKRMKFLIEKLPMLEYLEAFWAAGNTNRKGTTLITPGTLPPSLSCPSGYAPDRDIPTRAGDSNALFFPNGYTTLPPELQNAQPAVLLAVILEWLAEADVTLFDSSCINCEPISYLETMLPHLRGIIFFVLDLCCALLRNKMLNGTTQRTLALTFAAVLCRRSTTSSCGLSAFATDLAVQQSAVSFLLTWLALFEYRYKNL